MSHPSKVKGTRYEREVADTLAGYWPKADRQVLHGNRDHGDIVNVPYWTLECKNEQKLRLAEYMAEAEKEAENAKSPYFAAIVKRRGKNVAESYVVMPFWLWLSLAPVLENALAHLLESATDQPPGDAAPNGDQSAVLRGSLGRTRVPDSGPAHQ